MSGSDGCVLPVSVVVMILLWLCVTAHLVCVRAVITSQGPRWGGGEEEEDNEVREFKGWITGSKEDYFMSLESLLQRKKKIAGQSPKLDLFTPGIRNNYPSSSRANLSSLTYKKG